MNPEIKTKWLAALRSGEYRQGKRILRSSSDEYCCIGVLCDVVDNSKWEDNSKHFISYNGWKGSIHDFKPFGGLHEDLQEILINMNDRENKTFVEIADWIERNL